MADAIMGDGAEMTTAKYLTGATSGSVCYRTSLEAKPNEILSIVSANKVKGKSWTASCKWLAGTDVTPASCLTL
jgi:hypothetical protein